MLSRRLIFLYLFILFTGSFAQKYNLNVRNDDEQDDEDELGPKQLRQPSLNVGQSQNVVPSGNAYNNRDPPQRNFNQGPVPQKSRNSPSQSAVTQLAANEACASDVQKYCGKGNPQLITNLKVLQCVDDLDNVSFKKINNLYISISSIILGY